MAILFLSTGFVNHEGLSSALLGQCGVQVECADASRMRRSDRSVMGRNKTVVYALLNKMIGQRTEAALCLVDCLRFLRKDILRGSDRSSITGCDQHGNGGHRRLLLYVPVMPTLDAIVDLGEWPTPDKPALFGRSTTYLLTRGPMKEQVLAVVDFAAAKALRNNKLLRYSTRSLQMIQCKPVTDYIIQ